MSRLAPVLGMVVVVLLTAAAPADAHNGVGASFKGTAGHYTVYAYDGDPLTTGHLDYRLVVLDTETKEPVYDVRPRVTATGPDASSPVTAPVTTFGNVFFYELPNPYPRHWLVRLALAGPRGRGHVSFRVHGVAPTTATNPAAPIVSEHSPFPWAGVAIGAGAAITVLLLGWGLRRRQSPRAPDR